MEFDQENVIWYYLNCVKKNVLTKEQKFTMGSLQFMQIQCSIIDSLGDINQWLRRAL